MTPRLSPKKSWEGFVGSVVFSVGIACLLLHWLGDRMQPHDQPLITMPIAVCIGVAAAILGVWGDLAESVIKRGAGVKDSGTMVPGAGGLLDVLDSLVFVAPLFYWYIAFAKAQSIFTPVAEQLTN
jgi:phosphatidate cytidylyltransferase